MNEEYLTTVFELKCMQFSIGKLLGIEELCSADFALLFVDNLKSNTKFSKTLKMTISSIIDSDDESKYRIIYVKIHLMC